MLIHIAMCGGWLIARVGARQTILHRIEVAVFFQHLAFVKIQPQETLSCESCGWMDGWMDG